MNVANIKFAMRIKLKLRKTVVASGRKRMRKLFNWWDQFLDEAWPVVLILLAALYSVYVVSQIVGKLTEDQPVQYQEQPEIQP